MKKVLIAVALFALPAWAGDVSGPPRVVDGDTIEVAGQRIRLWGIDAAEMNTEAGRKAKRWLEAKLAGKTLRCEPRGTDKYRRIVAVCFLGSEDIARMLVDAGQARDWPRYSNGYYAR